jgi:LL-diaminopimelate aminotransferase
VLPSAAWRLVQALATLKTNIDSGQFTAIQAAGVAALTGPQDVVRERVTRWEQRRNMAVQGLRAAGLDVPMPRATFYLWLPAPAKFDSVGFAAHLLEHAGVMVTPGVGYGERGNGYVRISLTAPDERVAEAIQRIRDRLGVAAPPATR